MSFKLKPEIKEEWTAALRSDEYEQGQEYLLHNDKYCCLGVLCSIVAAKTTKDLWDYQNKNGEELPNQELVNIVSQEKLETMYVSDRSLWSYNEFGETLYDMNDQGHSFKEIADVIEEQF
jgi:hypothetical protein